MKKILLLIAVTLAFAGCSKDDEETTEQTVLINVNYEYEGGDKTYIASPTLVQLYNYDEAASFDKEESVSQMAKEQNIVLPDGTALKPVYTSDSYSGVNTLQNIKNGKYLAIVFFKPDGYSWSFLYFYGYKEIDVTPENNMKLYNLTFTWENNAGKFIAL